MRNLAICIPTYNRSEVLQDTLLYELDSCRDLGIDIYLYDSSTDGQSKILAESLKEYDNLYYVAIESTVELYDKVFMIYKSYGRMKQYDYIWLVGDGVSYSRELLEKVISTIQTYPTMVLINNEDRQKTGDKEYNDVISVFKELFWKSTLWGSVIVQERLYDNIDWKEYENLFSGYHVSTGLHWYRTAEIQNFCAKLLIAKKNIDLRKSPLKKMACWKGNEWGSELVYQVWAKELIDVIYKLPYEKDVIDEALETHRRYTKTFCGINLLRSRKDGVYNIQLYKKYCTELKILSHYPAVLLWLIAVTPRIIMKVIVRVLTQFSKN